MSGETLPLDRILEGVLLASSTPLALDRLELLFDERERPSRGELRAALGVLERRLAGSALTLLESASGFRLCIEAELSPWVSRLWEERPQRYSRALLETLALIVYRQPVTRGDIEEVRGVTISASIMRTLLERGWIRVIGHRDVPGRPAVYASTRTFLDDFGLKTLDELPPMSELAERFGDEPDLFEEEDGAARAAREATASLLLAADLGGQEDEDEDGESVRRALEDPLPQVSTLDFGRLNERLDERVRQREQRQGQESASSSERDTSEASDDERSFNDE